MECLRIFIFEPPLVSLTSPPDFSLLYGEKGVPRTILKANPGKLFQFPVTGGEAPKEFENKNFAFKLWPLSKDPMDDIMSKCSKKVQVCLSFDTMTMDLAAFITKHMSDPARVFCRQEPPLTLNGIRQSLSIVQLCGTAGM